MAKNRPPSETGGSVQNTVNEAAQLADVIHAWRHDFIAFFEVGLGIVLSNQQKELVQLVQALMWAKVKKNRGESMTPRERELAGKFGISVHSGKGLGKDFITAGLIIAVIFLFKNFKGICTSTSAKQLEDVLSSEVRKLLKRAHPLIRDSFIVDKGGFYKADSPGKKSTDFMAKRQANVKGSAEENADTLQGYHDDFMMLVADEASGIPDAVFKPLETTLTGLCNFVIMIGNVMRSNGYFYCSHYSEKDRAQWVQVRWDAEESDLEDIKPGLKEQIKRIEEKYGRDSNAFRMNVQGLPPAEEADALLPWSWITAAQDRWSETEVDAANAPVLLGVDVGRGGDDSAIAYRIGPKLMDVRVKKTPDTTVLADWLDAEIDLIDPDEVLIDSNGMGASFCDTLKRFYSRQFLQVNVGTGPSRKGEYGCLRDELWMDRVRRDFEPGTGRAAIPPHDEELAMELSSLKVARWDNPKRVESKKQMKARGVKSPNRADAYMHTYYFAAGQSLERKKLSVDKYQKKEHVLPNSNSWMGA